MSDLEPDPPVTRTSSRSAFEHVMTNVLPPVQHQQIHYAFTALGLVNIVDVLEVEKEDLESFSWTVEGDDTRHRLTKIEIKRVLALQHWYSAQEYQSIQPWLVLTSDFFDEFCAQYAVQGIQKLTTPEQTPQKPSGDLFGLGKDDESPDPCSLGARTTQTTQSAADMFAKSIRPRVDDYPAFQSDYKWF